MPSILVAKMEHYQGNNEYMVYPNLLRAKIIKLLFSLLKEEITQNIFFHYLVESSKKGTSKNQSMKEQCHNILICVYWNSRSRSEKLRQQNIFEEQMTKNAGK